MLVPPKQPPYVTPKGDAQHNPDQGAFWQFEESDRYRSGLFTRSANVFYRNPDALGSGYIAGIVTVACTPNASGYTTDTLATAYESTFAGRGAQGISIKSKQKVQQWERSVWEVRHEGGMFSATDPLYLFATPSYIYGITTVAHSSNELVRRVTAEVFDSIQIHE